jgi:hypothetical protein
MGVLTAAGPLSRNSSADKRPSRTEEIPDHYNQWILSELIHREFAAEVNVNVSEN